MPNGGRKGFLWNLRETAAARAQLDALSAADCRFQKIWDGIAWVILRDPTVAETAPQHTTVYSLKTVDFLAIGIPVMIVVYATISPDVVEIIEVHKAH